jgi:hypothetical protein
MESSVRAAERQLDREFNHSVGSLQATAPRTPFWTAVGLPFKPGFWSKVGQNGAAHWQEFVPGNRRDLRIAVIGDRWPMHSDATIAGATSGRAAVG